HCRGRRGTKVAGAFVGQRNRGYARDSLVDARAFIVEESKQLAFDQRAAHAAAKLVLVVLGLGQTAAVGEKVVGIKVLVAQVLVGKYVNVVGSAPGADGNRRAGAAAVLRGIRIGDDVEFLEGIHRGVGTFRAQLLDVLGERVVVYAIQNEVVLQRVDAMH